LVTSLVGKCAFIPIIGDITRGEMRIHSDYW
jgi:hypothetical protein